MNETYYLVISVTRYDLAGYKEKNNTTGINESEYSSYCQDKIKDLSYEGLKDLTHEVLKKLDKDAVNRIVPQYIFGFAPSELDLGDTNYVVKSTFYNEPLEDTLEQGSILFRGFIDATRGHSPYQLPFLLLYIPLNANEAQLRDLKKTGEELCDYVTDGPIICRVPKELELKRKYEILDIKDLRLSWVGEVKKEEVKPIVIAKAKHDKPTLLKTERFIKKLLPQSHNMLFVQANAAVQNQDLTIYANNPSVLHELSKSICKLIDSKLVVLAAHQLEMVDNNNNNDVNFSLILLPAHLVDKLCKKLDLPYTPKNICYELISNGAQLKDVHTLDASGKYQIDMNQPLHIITFREYKSAYNAKYQSEIFKNPFDKMKNKLNDGTFKTLEDVEECDKENPNPRVKQVFSSLMYGSP